HTRLIPFLRGSGDHQLRLSFPTRRSSDLSGRGAPPSSVGFAVAGSPVTARCTRCSPSRAGPPAASGGARPPARQARRAYPPGRRSEEHTSELQSRENLVCRLLLEKKKQNK